MAMVSGAGAMGHSQTIQINRDNRTLAVTATDTASALADRAVVSVGFEAYGADEERAYAAGSQRSNAVMDALLKAGVAKGAIESESQGLQPLQPYEIQNAAAALQGMRFKLSQSWTVRTKPDDAARVLDAAVKAGANRSGAIDWQVEDASALESEAAGKALAHAQVIAERMAGGLHTKIGPLLYASNQAQERSPVPLGVMRAAVSEQTIKPLALATRKVERSATVYAVFALE